jgi:hypothetical protein
MSKCEQIFLQEGIPYLSGQELILVPQVLDHFCIPFPARSQNEEQNVNTRESSNLAAPRKTISSFSFPTTESWSGELSWCCVGFMGKSFTEVIVRLSSMLNDITEAFGRGAGLVGFVVVEDCDLLDFGVGADLAE